MNALQLEYERDFYSWIAKNVELLKHRRFAELDVDVLIDELESMAKRDKRELTSRLMVLIAHLLKWQFQPEQRSGSWRGSIREQRIKIARQLDESPSLINYLDHGVKMAYPDALKLVSAETGMEIADMPRECPYSMEQLLDDEFYSGMR